MKITRAKKAHKVLGFYKNNFKFREPYQVLVDGTFCQAALENKFDIQDQVPRYFAAETKILTTPCIIMETEKLGAKTYGAMLIVKKFPLHKCGHEKSFKTGSECLRSMIGAENLSRYTIATQDRKLQDELRQIPGVPLMYLHGKAPTIEQPSRISKEYAEKLVQGLGVTANQQEQLKTLKEKLGIVEEKPSFKKKRKQKGKNPLSCLKKKDKKISNSAGKNETEKSGKIRKRKRVKIPAHVKEILKSST